MEARIGRILPAQVRRVGFSLASQNKPLRPARGESGSDKLTSSSRVSGGPQARVPAWFDLTQMPSSQLVATIVRTVSPILSNGPGSAVAAKVKSLLRNQTRYKMIYTDASAQALSPEHLRI